jgi:sugar transferase (PEP-CTERM/EpsH1 system associated)
MKILFLAQRLPPDRLRDGEDLRIYHLAKGLSRNHELLFVGYENDADQSAESAKLFEKIHLRPEAPKGASRGKLSERLIDAFSPSRLYPFDAQLFKIVSEIVDGGDVGAIWIPSWRMIPYSSHLHSVPLYIDVMDDGVLEHFRDLRQSGSLQEWILKLKRLMMIFLFERKYFSAATLCCVVTEEDAKALKRVCPKARVAVVPNGVDSEFFKPGVCSHDDDDSIVFEGNMSFTPNIDAATYFCSSILPRITAAKPHVKIQIVGLSPSPEVERLANEHVIVTGTVSDIRPYLEHSALFVCPMRKGACIKNKILQAWAMAKPVIATSIAVAGLHADVGRNILVANNPDEFADLTLRLLEDPERRRSLGREGRATVLQHHSWDRQVNLLERRMTEAADVFA